MLILCIRDLMTCLDKIIIKIINFQPGFLYSTVITDIVIDSRKVTPNCIFVAIKGNNNDGHHYLAEVDSKAAVLAIVEEIHEEIDLPQIQVNDTKLALGEITKFLRAAWKKPIVAITGSNGKTTTKFMLAKMLETKGEVLYSPMSFNNNIGIPLTMIQATKRQWAGVFEVGTNHPGEIAYLSGLIKSEIAIITTVSATHIGNFASVDAISEEKFNIFNSLKLKGVAIYSYENNYKKTWAEKLNQRNIKQLTFGFDSAADVYADQIKLSPTNSEFRLNYKNSDEKRSIQINLKLLGKHQISNALAASAAALTLGIGLNSIKLALDNLQPVVKRMQPIKLQNNVVIIDDSYNASPASMHAALDYLSSCPGKKIAVLGDMGELGHLAKDEHLTVGNTAKKLKIDLLFAIGDFSKYTLQAFCGEEVSTKQSHNSCQLFADKISLSKTLQVYLAKIIDQNEPVTVLVKGSNFMKMWEISEQLANIECLL